MAPTQRAPKKRQGGQAHGHRESEYRPARQSSPSTLTRRRRGCRPGAVQVAEQVPKMILRLGVRQAQGEHALEEAKLCECFAAVRTLNEMDVHAELIRHTEATLGIFNDNALDRVAFHESEIPSD